MKPRSCISSSKTLSWSTNIIPDDIIDFFFTKVEKNAKQTQQTANEIIDKNKRNTIMNFDALNMKLRK